MRWCHSRKNTVLYVYLLRYRHWAPHSQCLAHSLLLCTQNVYIWFKRNENYLGGKIFEKCQIKKYGKSENDWRMEINFITLGKLQPITLVPRFRLILLIFEFTFKGCALFFYIYFISFFLHSSIFSVYKYWNARCIDSNFGASCCLPRTYTRFEQLPVAVAAVLKFSMDFCMNERRRQRRHLTRGGT